MNIVLHIFMKQNLIVNYLHVIELFPQSLHLLLGEHRNVAEGLDSFRYHTYKRTILGVLNAMEPKGILT